MREVGARAMRTNHAADEDELATATELVRGHRFVEVLGTDGATTEPSPEIITLPDLRPLSNFISAPCKHACNIIKQMRHNR